MGYGLMIWEMTVSIWSSWISIWDILSPWFTCPYPVGVLNPEPLVGGGAGDQGLTLVHFFSSTLALSVG
jgi:hypothetical protein